MGHEIKLSTLVNYPAGTQIKNRSIVFRQNFVCQQIWKFYGSGREEIEVELRSYIYHHLLSINCDLEISYQMQTFYDRQMKARRSIVKKIHLLLNNISHNGK